MNQCFCRLLAVDGARQHILSAPPAVAKMRALGPKALAIASLFLVLGLLGCDKAALQPSISKTVERVDGFDLIFDDSKGPASSGLFEVGYAIKANYAYFTYRGRLYRSVGGGSVVIRDVVGDSPAKFIVRETALARSNSGYTKRSFLQVIEKQNGEELARRSLIDGAVEDSTGWTGDHAIRFLRQILQSTQAPNRPWNGTDYLPADARVRFVAAESTVPYTYSDVTADCPNDVRIVRRPANSAIVTASFEFLPSSPLRFAACNSGILLVGSGVWGYQLNLDLLTLDGTPLAQGHVRLPLPFEALVVSLSELRVDATSVEFVVSANRPSADFQWSPYRRLSITARLPATSASRIP